MVRAVKHFRNFSFKSDEKSKYQVGPMFNFSTLLLEKYYLNKIHRFYINEDNYPEFYNYHLTFFKENNPNSHEKEHFAYIWRIVQNRITLLQFKFSARAVSRREKLENFQDYLKSIDAWDISLDPIEQTKKWNKFFNKLTKGQRHL